MAVLVPVVVMAVSRHVDEMRCPAPAEPLVGRSRTIPPRQLLRPSDPGCWCCCMRQGAGKEQTGALGIALELLDSSGRRMLVLRARAAWCCIDPREVGHGSTAGWLARCVCASREQGSDDALVVAWCCSVK